jgi:hypothetical protein
MAVAIGAGGRRTSPVASTKRPRADAARDSCGVIGRCYLDSASESASQCLSQNPLSGSSGEFDFDRINAICAIVGMATSRSSCLLWERFDGMRIGLSVLALASLEPVLWKIGSHVCPGSLQSCSSQGDDTEQFAAPGQWF